MENQKHPCVRCPHCAGPLSKDLETSSWTISPLIRDSFSMTPLLMLFSSACAGLAGGAFPAVAQLVLSSYHAADSSLSISPPISSEDGKKPNKSATSSTL
ncbi:hypothetical protein MKW98_019191 [Papaver atlanticum]|uniref:Uncharacterized protein n=1 Tax=Papaver atlanticum TaxID=357466 RepID=A0AAD4TBZ3_9MAGN|nr:hypothetical protein MKW98_019191 [Papaver atlanticum]